MLKQKWIIAVAASLGLATGLIITTLAEPGTATDPLVSRSYVNARIAELEARISALSTEGITVQPTQPPQPPQPPPQPTQPATRELFTIVRAESGSILFGGASTEIILRAGEATVVSGPNGFANVTAGWDIMNGEPVPLNNLLIVPNDDGRGLRFHTVSYLLIRGDFYFGN
ncbi:MAG: hypothetical protein FWG65_13530 [Turicibacter sp.]|nr:hypothetical protein [Turicibacter sp.]